MGNIILYFLVAVLATTAGAMTGMGGGVIIKPLLDVLQHFDAATINTLSSLTVLAMALVSVYKQVRARARLDVKIAIPLAVGSVAGGLLGGEGIDALIRAAGGGKSVFVVQNSVLAVLIVLVFVYMLKKDKLPTLGLRGVPASLVVGLLLGAISSFLGIGGGPVNVALIIFVFSMGTKEAAVCSLVIILFAQLTKVATTLLAGGYGAYNLSMLPAMVVGAVLGGLLGSKLHKEFSEKRVETMFNIVQVLVFGLCILNIIRNL